MIIYNFVSCSNRTFMELKSISGRTNRLRRRSSNRTFMELKYERLNKNRSRLTSSNRTFMELKYLMNGSTPSAPSVLIVPLWN